MREEGNIEETKEVKKPKKEDLLEVPTIEEIVDKDRILIAVLLMEQSKRRARKHMREMNFTDEEIEAVEKQYLERKEIRH